jgi:hypothetical protein
MTNNEITAILAATAEQNLYLEDGSYLDWSTGLEVADAEGNTVQIDMTRDDKLALLRALAASLLQ